MTWFTENPAPPVVLGILIEAALAVVLMKTGRRSVLWGMLATAAFAITAVVASFLIVTPRESVTAALEELRLMVEQNDRTGLLARIDPQAVSLRNQVQGDQMYLTVERAKMNDLKVTVDDAGTVAKAEFIGVIDVRDAGGRLPYNHLVLQFTVHLKKSHDVWIVTSAEYQPITLGGSGDNAAPRRVRSNDGALIG